MLLSTPLHNLVLYFGETRLVVREAFKLGGGVWAIRIVTDRSTRVEIY